MSGADLDVAVQTAGGLMAEPDDPRLASLAADGDVLADQAADRRAQVVGFGGILDCEGADSAMALPLFLRFAQVRGLADATRESGQGRGRTADLPLFRGSIPSETMIS